MGTQGFEPRSTGLEPAALPGYATPPIPIIKEKENSIYKVFYLFLNTCSPLHIKKATKTKTAIAGKNHKGLIYPPGTLTEVIPVNSKPLIIKNPIKNTKTTEIIINL